MTADSTFGQSPAPGVALIARFEGDADQLTAGFRDVARRYAALADAPQPATALLARNRDGITVVLAWDQGASLQPFRDFLRDALGDTGLPHPHVEHLRAEAATWEQIVILT